ncbi:MAG: putative Ig domain-containing protein, partial [Ilumatobacteraceae bacterium]
LPSGLTFSTVTGLISGTPTVQSPATDYTITARRVDSGNGAVSTSTAVYNFGVYTVAPTTTTTSSTTTTLPPATTTVPTTVAAPSLEAAPVVQPADGAPVVSPPLVPTTSVLRSSTATVAAPVTTSTAPTPTTTTTVPPPVAPEAAPGESGATVDGEPVETRLSRADNALVVEAGDVSATIHGVGTDGLKVPLDQDGILQLENTDRLFVSASGYEPGGDVEIWLRSSPVRLATVTTDSRGRLTGTFAIPAAVEPGDHRVVLAGRTASGGESVIGVGLRIGEYGTESGVNRWFIIVPIVLATILGLVIPTTTRRRRRAHG